MDYTSPGARTVLADAAQPPDAGKGDVAFCSGGDQGVRGKGGYVGADGVPRLNVLDLQVCYHILKLLLPPTSCTSSLAAALALRSAVCHASDQGHGPVSHTTASLLVFVATALPEGFRHDASSRSNAQKRATVLLHRDLLEIFGGCQQERRRRPIDRPHPSPQMQIRRLPKPVIAMVAGFAVGGGHILHMMCDLTIAADNAVFGQTGPKVGSFDAGYGSTQMARLIGMIGIATSATACRNCHDQWASARCQHAWP